MQFSTNPSKPNLVVFCGAGFSAPMDIPTMAGFSDALRQSQYLNPVERDAFDRIQTACSGFATTIGASARNLEELASFLSILDVCRPDYKFVGCKRFSYPKDALKLVNRCIRHLTQPHLSTKTGVFARNWLTQCASGTNFSVVTTNYDVAIELAAVTANATPIQTAKVMESRRSIHFTPKRSLFDLRQLQFRMFKLHGSVNWIKSGTSIEVEDRLVPDRRAQGEHVTIGNPDDEEYKSADAVIVPPTVLKPRIEGIIGEQWQGASDVLESADMLWFIGYSFPASDSFMRYFLSAALTENPRLNQIVVIDPEIEVIEARARPLFAAPHHAELFHGFPLKWGEINLSALLSRSSDGFLDDGTLRRYERAERERAVLDGTPMLPPEPGRSRKSIRERGGWRDRTR